MGKGKLVSELETRLETLAEHYEKRKQAIKAGHKPHEIATLDKQIERMEAEIAPLQQKVGRGVEECPDCGKEVVPVSNRCPKCDAYMG